MLFCLTSHYKSGQAILAIFTQAKNCYKKEELCQKKKRSKQLIRPLEKL